MMVSIGGKWGGEWGREGGRRGGGRGGGVDERGAGFMQRCGGCTCRLDQRPLVQSVRVLHKSQPHFEPV